MNRFDIFNAQLAKFQSVLADNKLAGEFQTSRYPISLVITQEQTDTAQMEMFPVDEADGVSSKDAKLVLTFPLEGIGVHVYGRLIISESLMNKIKLHGKKLRDSYLQAFFATLKDSESKYSDSAIRDIEDDEFEEEDAADFAEFFNAEDEEEDSED